MQFACIGSHAFYLTFLLYLVGTSAIAAGVSTLTSAAAITTIFGVGGAGVY